MSKPNSIRIDDIEYVRADQVAPREKGNRKIIRTYSAGVFFGELVETSRSVDGQRGTVKNARRIWYWEGASSLSELAEKGTSKPDKCKFPLPVAEVELMNIIEVLSVSEAAAKSIDAVKVWTQHG